MSLCRTSVAADVPRLKALWQLCFGDEERYIDYFFRKAYVPERALVLEQEGEVVSMLITFPQKLVSETGEQRDACYIYAFCTHPDHQSRGYGRALLSFAEERALSEGCAAAIMVPGEESLFRFYAGLGYDTVLHHRDVVWQRGELPITAPGMTAIDAETYAAERSRWLAGWNRVDHEAAGLGWQRALCVSSGSGFYRLAHGIAAVEVWDDVAEVKELLCDDFKAAAAAICAGLGTQSVHCYLPDVVELGERRPFAVVKALGGAEAVPADSYFAFGFD